jgi:hypothetical protein
VTVHGGAVNWMYPVTKRIGGKPVSIVRVGLGETKNFAEGYEAIFGKKTDEKKKEETAAAAGERAEKEEKKDEKK